MSYGDIKKELKQLCENGWDASFSYAGQNCAIFPNTSTDFLVSIGDNDYHARSYDELINLDISGKTLVEVISKSTDIQYY
ncbi:Uncharacterised protein [Streptococcus porcinus]|uniref:16S rRNA processing protein RimM n=1 Tax=Streptococcus porcinus TaxID=1340 RepID=UPI0010CACD0B|nr:16S rRNA processing protein RimM [Streptococcus porcinus]VTS32858.1 Uncharacterised protein [Streptococcus porcinus]